MAIGPRGVDVSVRGGPPADGRVRAEAGTGATARAEGAQGVQEESQQERAALLEQTEELVRWLSATLEEARKELAEALLAATEP